MIFYPFLSQHPIAAAHLPLTLISLEDWVLVALTGSDSEKYLQSQVTADIHQLTRHQHLLTAHCDPKGKTWSSLRLFRQKDGFLMIERRSLLDIQLNELKKCALFSKVAITIDDKRILLGVAGFQARTVLKDLFSELPNIGISLVNDDATSLLWFKYPTERFLLITDRKTAEHIIKELHNKAQLNDSQQWLSLNIEAGEPVIDIVNSRKFIPQAINLEMLGGISFKKGCYLGQEAVARAKFRGTNKCSLWYLSGHSSRIPEAGEKLEMKIGNNWRRTGTILAAVKLNNGNLLVQVIMNSNIKENSIFRIRNEITNVLSIKPLPYSFN